MTHTPRLLTLPVPVISFLVIPNCIPHKTRLRYRIVWSNLGIFSSQYYMLIVLRLLERPDTEEENSTTRSQPKEFRIELRRRTRIQQNNEASAVLRMEDKKNKKARMQFAVKLHIMLEDADNEGNDGIVGWQHDGLSFSIYKPKEFAEKIMPRYFRQTRFRDFQRQVRPLFYQALQHDLTVQRGSFSWIELVFLRLTIALLLTTAILCRYAVIHQQLLYEERERWCKLGLH